MSFNTVSGKSDKSTLEKIRNNWQGNKPDNVFKVHIGPVASGAAVLANINVVDDIKMQSRKLLGVEMETYGVLYSAENCSKPRPIPFSIKSVCDFADSSKNDNYQRYAAYTSSQLLFELSMKYLDYNFF